MAGATNEHERQDAADQMRATDPREQGQRGPDEDRDVENYRDEYDMTRPDRQQHPSVLTRPGRDAAGA